MAWARRGWVGVGQKAPWLVVLATLLVVGPAIARRALGAGESREPYLAILVACGVQLVAGVAVLGARPGLFRRADGRVSWPSVVLGVVVSIGAALAVTQALIGSWRWLSTWLPTAVLGCAALVLVHTLGRPPLTERSFGLRTATAASLLVAADALSRACGGGFVWACLSPIVSAEAAAAASADALPHSLLTASLVIGLVATVLVRRARALGRARVASLLPLVSLAVLLGGRATCAVLAGAAAVIVGEAAHGPPPPADAVEALAIAADVVGGSSVALGVALFVLAFARAIAAPRAGDRGTATLRATWALVPLALVLGSPALEPPVVVRFPQQAPEAVWREAQIEPLVRTRPADDVRTRDVIPFLHTRAANAVSGVLRSGGDLVVFQGGRSRELPFVDELVDAPRDVYWGSGIELVVDRRATIGDLRHASLALAGFESISIVWLSTDLGRASRAAERWAFVDVASRALRAHELQLVRTDAECGAPAMEDGLTVRRCGGASEPSTVLVGDEERPVAELLDWLDRGSRGRVALFADEPDDRDRWQSVNGAVRPRDPASMRWVPRDATAALLGAVIALALVLARGAWWRRAGRARVGLTAPYRDDARLVERHPDAGDAFSWQTRTLASVLFHGALQWTFAAVVATLVGLALR